MHSITKTKHKDYKAFACTHSTTVSFGISELQGKFQYSKVDGISRHV